MFRYEEVGNLVIICFSTAQVTPGLLNLFLNEKLSIINCNKWVSVQQE